MTTNHQSHHRRRRQRRAHDETSLVWVQTSVVQAILDNNGSLPQNYKPSRKKGRSGTKLSWGWARARIVGNTTTGNEQTIQIAIQDAEYAPDHLYNATVEIDASLVYMSNAPFQEPPDDLTKLTHLHEPAVVHCLKQRYQANQIYTYTGKILIALNPFRSCPNLYGPNVIQLYTNNNHTSSQQPQPQPPHVYAVAQDAHYQLLSQQKSQSILVSGESGAGKTVTTKFILQYLTTTSQRLAHPQKNHNLETHILQSNPILESFGNARTVRNDNSSRFGKYINVVFCKRGTLLSATITTYLLEKVRLISQAPGERNYHVFYQVLEAMPQKIRHAYKIGNVTARDFKMTASSGTFERRDGVSDVSTYKELQTALNAVGFTPEEQHDLFVVVCALLHASNLTFSSPSSTREEFCCQLDRANPSLRSTHSLLGVPLEQLETALTKCAIEARGETLYKHLSMEQASKALDALVMATYGALFSHIVKRINASISACDDSNTSMQQQEDYMTSIGVLDIFGFECFHHNSFEQLCINYCNEALQQQFNRFVFKLEQQEYEREGIEWAFIHFPDNQDVLDLIEAKKSGILSILDEQCRLPTCTDMSFARAAYEMCGSHGRFVATNNQKVVGAFSIHHYAGPVEYSAVNFLEKNKDELPKETTELLMSSENSFLASLGQLLRNQSNPQQPSLSTRASAGSNSTTPSRRLVHRQSSSLMRDSVGTQFAKQLAELRERINQTTPHYIRCLKPNDGLLPDDFHPMVIADQLRCAGVLEAIRVSRVGFPQRYAHEAFVQRYHMLATKPLKQKDRLTGEACKEACRVLVEQASVLIFQMQDDSLTKDDSMFRKNKRGQEMPDLGIQLGLTKVFLRREAFDSLEILRGLRLESASIKIQSVARMFIVHSYFEECLVAAILIQRLARRVKAVRYFHQLQRNHAATRMQRAWRVYIAMHRFFAARAVAQWCQCAYRGSKGREEFAFVLLEHVATIIQKNWRRFFAFQRFQIARWVVIRLQCRWRSVKAKQELKRLRFKARDLSAIAAERDRFREEALRLRQELERKEAKQRSITSKTNGRAEVTVTPAEVERLKNEIEKLQAQLQQEKYAVDDDQVKMLAAESAKKDAELARLRDEIAFLRSPEARTPQRVSVPCPAEAGRKSITPGFNDEQHMSPVREAVPWPTDNSKSITPVSNGEQRRPPASIFRVKASPTGSIQSMCTWGSRSRSDSNDKPSSSPQEKSRSDSLNKSSFSLLDTDIVDNAAMMYVSPLSNQRSNTCSAEQSFGPMSPGATADAVQQKTAMIDTLMFRKAVREGDSNTVESILKTSNRRDMLVNEVDESGQSPLHMAVIESRWKVVGVLLGNDGVPNAQDLAGNTPLHLAPSASMMALLLDDGRANPNIPNMDGDTALHFAVRKLDEEAVEVLLRHGANVNYADNTKWYTPLHLIAQADLDDRAKLELPPDEYQEEKETRMTIASLLCTASDPSPEKPDLDYQDWEGNTPLHHVVMLTSEIAAAMLSVFLEKGANPRVANKRGQTPLHLLCHNESLRKLMVFQEMMHDMLYHGADPNQISLTGCTALHLSLYHRDVDSAIQLVNSGAELHLLWRKPKRWVSFWDGINTSEVLALDMVSDEHNLHRILAAINRPQKMAPARSWCMHCKSTLGSFARALHCRHCGRLVCGACAPRAMAAEFFPKSFEIYEASWVCVVCEKVLVSRKEDNSSMTQPTTSSSTADDSRLSVF